MHAASAESISAHAARQPNTAAPRAEKLVLGSAPLASHRLRNRVYAFVGVDDIPPDRLPQAQRGSLARFPCRRVRSSLGPGVEVL